LLYQDDTKAAHHNQVLFILLHIFIFFQMNHTNKKTVLLHSNTVRFLGNAGYWFNISSMLLLMSVAIIPPANLGSPLMTVIG